jgi:hypothetical protein
MSAQMAARATNVGYMETNLSEYAFELRADPGINKDFLLNVIPANPVSGDFFRRGSHPIYEVIVEVIDHS